MTLRVLTRETRLPFAAEVVWQWHLRPGALQRLLPPWSGVRIVHADGAVTAGSRVELAVPALGRHWPWVARHEVDAAARTFADVQERGPFRQWRHTHRIRADGDGCILEDQVEFAPPLGALGRWFISGHVERDLDRLFTWRRQRLIDDLGRHQACAARTPLTVAISGARGLLGSSLSAFLGGGGHRVRHLVRSGGEGIAWDPGRSVDVAALSACDAVVHLAGANVADQRWTPEFKSRLWSSRVEATRHLCEALAAAPQRPKVLLCASGVGIYGVRREEAVKEDSLPGDDFLARLCVAWEDACAPARAAGIRVVNLRFGVVLAAAGGALAKLVPAVRWGVAGPVAGGNQQMPWLALDDALGAILHLLHDDQVSGPVNMVAPVAMTNRDLVRSIGRVLRRPTVLPLPAFAVRLLFGEMGEATLLASSRVLPGSLLAAGFSWRHREYDEWLRFELKG